MSQLDQILYQKQIDNTQTFNEWSKDNAQDREKGKAALGSLLSRVTEKIKADAAEQLTADIEQAKADAEAAVMADYAAKGMTTTDPNAKAWRSFLDNIDAKISADNARYNKRYGHLFDQE